MKSEEPIEDSESDTRDVPPLSEEWLAEIQRRSDEFDAGKVVPIPWAVVRDRARRRKS